jgi:hypothetical protein
MPKKRPFIGPRRFIPNRGQKWKGQGYWKDKKSPYYNYPVNNVPDNVRYEPGEKERIMNFQKWAAMPKAFRPSLSSINYRLPTLTEKTLQKNEISQKQFKKKQMYIKKKSLYLRKKYRKKFKKPAIGKHRFRQSFFRINKRKQSVSSQKINRYIKNSLATRPLHGINPGFAGATEWLYRKHVQKRPY